MQVHRLVTLKRPQMLQGHQSLAVDCKTLLSIVLRSETFSFLHDVRLGLHTVTDGVT